MWAIRVGIRIVIFTWISWYSFEVSSMVFKGFVGSVMSVMSAVPVVSQWCRKTRSDPIIFKSRERNRNRNRLFRSYSLLLSWTRNRLLVVRFCWKSWFWVANIHRNDWEIRICYIAGLSCRILLITRWIDTRLRLCER